MRRLRIAVVATALAAMGLVGPDAPAHASCHVIAEELGCTESIPCRVAAKFGITMNCFH